MFLTCLGAGDLQECQNFCTQSSGATLYKESYVEGTSDEMVVLEGAHDENKDSKYETLRLFRNSYSLRLYNAFSGYISDEKNHELAEGSFLSLARLYVWPVQL